MEKTTTFDSLWELTSVIWGNSLKSFKALSCLRVSPISHHKTVTQPRIYTTLPFQTRPARNWRKVDIILFEPGLNADLELNQKFICFLKFQASLNLPLKIYNDLVIRRKSNPGISLVGQSILLGPLTGSPGWFISFNETAPDCLGARIGKFYGEFRLDNPPRAEKLSKKPQSAGNALDDDHRNHSYSFSWDFNSKPEFSRVHTLDKYGMAQLSAWAPKGLQMDQWGEGDIIMIMVILTIISRGWYINIIHDTWWYIHT